MTRLEDFKDKEWLEEEEVEGQGKRVFLYQQIVGKSGVYLVVTDPRTGEVIRDDRPWQMQAGVS